MRPGPHRPPHAVRPQPPPLPPTSTHNGSTVTSDAPRGLPPGLDRNEPVPVRYASKHTGGKKTGSKPRPPSDENEKALVKCSLLFNSLHMYMYIYVHVHVHV